MAYPGYDAKTKLEIIKRIWKGAKVAPISRKLGISRDSIHRWINKAEKGALKSVSPSAPGPKVDLLGHLKEENEYLNSLVQKLQDKLKALSQISQITVSTKTPSLLEERPSKCPKCGATRIWKNGTYQVKGERTSRSLMVKEKGTVQRFRCSHCGVKLYLVKKNQNEKVEKIEIYLKEAILVNEPLKNVFSFKEKIISLEKVELSSNLGSSFKSGPLFRVILAKRLDLRIEEKRSDLPESYPKETLSEKKTLFFESVNPQGSIQINVGLDEFDEFLPSGFLAILANFAKSLGFFDPFLKHLHIPMKEVKYSMMDKIATLFSSIAIGSSHIKDIDHKLTPYPLVASLFDMDRFPDQSGINRFLNRMGPEQVTKLCLVFEAILNKVSLFKDEEKVDLNVDATGLVVYRDRYQFAKKKDISLTKEVKKAINYL